MLNFFEAFLKHPSTMLVLMFFSASFLFKLFLTIKFSYNLQIKKRKIFKFLLFFILICDCVTDSSWILPRLYCIGISVPRAIWLLDYRLAFIAYIIQSTMLSIFIESLTGKINFKSIRYISIISISSLWTLTNFIIALTGYEQFYNKTSPYIELFFSKATLIYAFIIIITSIIIALKKIKKTNLSKLAAKQTYTFLTYLVLPKIAIELVLFIPTQFFPLFRIPRLFAGVVGTFITSGALYYCIKKMLAIRFLNIKKSVQRPRRTEFSEHWSVLIKKLAHVTNINELKYIVAQFSRDAFNMKRYSASLYIRKLNSNVEEPEYINPKHAQATEDFLCTYYYHNKYNVADFLKLYKIIIRDEIEYSNFCEKTDTHNVLINFLDSINADVFVPIYEKGHIIGYIIIDKCARKELYSETNSNEFIILADYLGIYIKLLQQGDVEQLIAQKKRAEEEAFKKHQQINSYKETMHNLIVRSREQKIGFINYQRGKFWYENKVAQELVPVDLNTEHGLPITQQIHKCVKQALQYKTIQTDEITGINEEKLKVTLLPGSSESSCTLSICRPVISKSLVEAIEKIHNPSDMDYRLYLETTQSGQLINKALPGSNPTLLQFKTNLLELSLTKKAVVLNMVEPDLDIAAQILHKISLRTTLQTIELTQPEENFETAMQLLGTNPLLTFQSPEEKTKGLLETLHNVGTIFIKNIEYLDLETQEYIAHYLHYGFFKEFRSERSIESSVRIICSTNQNLHALTKKGKFSPALLNELKHTTLTMPSLLLLPEKEVEELTEELADKLITNKEFRSALQLTNYEKHRIIKERPISVHELKELIIKQLKSKARYHEINHAAKITTEEAAQDPIVLKAARLGKHALKDRQLMLDLWEKFQSQSKIADLLGVNRSSVNRRLKSFNIFDT